MNWPTGPSVAEERAEAVKKIVPSQPATPWKHNGLLLRIVFTVLAAIAVSMAFGFFALLMLPRAHQGLDAGERLLLAADGLDGVHLAERELEVEAEERLLDPRRLRFQLLVGHVVQALYFFVPLH